MASSPSTTSQDPAQTRRRAAVASFIGSTVEYYDFLLYTVAAALVFPHVFFPELATGVGTIASFGTLAVGYFARPVGAIVCGHFGDRIGRKSMLVLTMSLMGVSSVVMGVIPSYDSIGILAPILLVLARLSQGLATGGEWGGSVLVSTEAAPDKKGLFGGFTQAGGPAGGLLSTAFMTLMSHLPEDQFLSWGWRIPFLASAILVAFGLIVRLSLTESQEFANVRKHDAIVRVPIKDVLVKHWRMVVVAVLVAIGAQAAQGLFSTYMLAYATGLGYAHSVTLNTKIFMNIGNFVGVLFFAWLSDFVGKRRLVAIGAIAFMVVSFPLFAIVNTVDAVSYGIVMVVMYTAVQPMMHGPTAGLLSELFPANLRYSGTAFSYQLGAVLGAGLAPLIASTLLAANGGGTHTQFISLFMIGVGIVTLAGVTAAGIFTKSRATALRPAEAAAAVEH